MASTINFGSLDWTDGDDFTAFAFGDFNSKAFYIKNPEEDDEQKQIKGGIIRTSDGDRYNINLSPTMQDKTVDIPGGDGQYYFGTYHKPKVFDVSFAFDDLTQEGLRKLKQAFSGKEMREFVLSEESDKIYMVKVTGQPNIKALCFDEDGVEIYKGEGSVQFTAYWPYGRGGEQSSTISINFSGSGNGTITNSGDVPTYVMITSNGGLDSITIDGKTIKPNNNSDKIFSFDSKKGLVKNSNNQLISYEGPGVISIPVGQTSITLKGQSNTSSTVKYYNWYY